MNSAVLRQITVDVSNILYNEYFIQAGEAMFFVFRVKKSTKILIKDFI